MGGAGFPPCWLFCLRQPNTGAYLGLWWGQWPTLEGLTPRSTSQNFCCQCPCPHGEPQPPPTSAGDTPTLAGRSGSVSPRVTAPSPGSWCTHYFVCALQEWSLCFSQSCRSPAIKSCQPSKSASLGIPPPVAGPPGWEPDMRFRTFTPVGGLLWYKCSPICESPTQQLWDLILLWLCPSYHLIVASPLSLDVGYLFLVSSSVFLLMIVQQLVVVLVFSQEGVRARPSTPPSWFLISPFGFNCCEALVMHSLH